MKNALFLVSFLFSSLFAMESFAKKIDLGDIVGRGSGSSSGGNPLDGVEKKLTEKVDKIIDKVDGKVNKITDKIDKYEKKADEYEKKIDEAGKAADKLINVVQNFDMAKIAPYINNAKYIVIGILALIALPFILSILIFLQLMKVNGKLKKLEKSGK